MMKDVNKKISTNGWKSEADENEKYGICKVENMLSVGQ